MPALRPDAMGGDPIETIVDASRLTHGVRSIQKPRLDPVGNTGRRTVLAAVAMVTTTVWVVRGARENTVRRLLERARLRWGHLSIAGVSATLVYFPGLDDATTRAVLRFVLFPALTVSGMVLWNMAAIQRWRRRERVGTAAR